MEEHASPRSLLSSIQSSVIHGVRVDIAQDTSAEEERQGVQEEAKATSNIEGKRKQQRRVDDWATIKTKVTLTLGIISFKFDNLSMKGIH